LSELINSLIKRLKYNHGLMILVSY